MTSNINIKETNKFGEISSYLSRTESTLNSYESKLEGIGSGLSGELASCYNSHASPVKSKIANLRSKISKASSHIRDSVAIYEMADNYLSTSLNELYDAVFKDELTSDSAINMDSVDSSKKVEDLTLEERKKYLQNVIDSYEKALKQLEDEFQKKYGDGIPYIAQDFRYVAPILYAMGFHIIDMSKFDTNGRLTYTFVSDIITFCDENQVFDRTIKYLNGDSYKNTIGKIDFGDNYSKYTDDDYLEDEKEFLYRIGQWYDINLKYDDVGNNKKIVTNKLVEDDIIRLSNNKYEFTNLNFINDTREYVNEYNRYVKDIQTLSSAIYNYKQGMKLLPYQTYMEDADFKEFLENDFNKLKDQYIKELGVDADYLTDDEIALYAYLSRNVSATDANGYLSALTDTLNNRKGLAEALKYFAEINKNGYGLDDDVKTMLDGFGEGLTSFFEGIGKFFNPSDIRSVNDYLMYYKVALLTNPEMFNLEKEGIELLLSEDARRLLKINHNVFSGAGNMLIPQLISLTGAGIAALTKNPAIATFFRGLSMALLGASAAGKEITNSLAKGHDIFHSYLYGVLSGASEALFEKLGGIIGLGDFGENILGATGFADFMKRYFQSMVKEGLEEFFQQYFDAAIESIILGEPFDLTKTTGDALIAGLYGMAVAGVMNAGAVVTITISGKVYKFLASELAKRKFNELDLTRDSESIIEELYQETLAEYMQMVQDENIDSLEDALDYIRNSNMNDLEKNRLLDASVKTLVQNMENPAEAVVKLYSELTRILHYDESATVDSNVDDRIDSHMDLLNMPDNDNVVCSEFSTVFYDLLRRAGFSDDQVKIIGTSKANRNGVQTNKVTHDKHRWVQVDLGDGRIMIADATDAMKGRTDFTSSKAGLDFVGLVILDKRYAGTRISDVFNLGLMYIDGKEVFVGEKGKDIIKQGRVDINEIIKKLGPLEIGEYDIVADLFGGEEFEDISLDDKVDTIQKILDEVDLTSFELYHILRELKLDVEAHSLPDGSLKITVVLRDPTDSSAHTYEIVNGDMTEVLNE